MLGSAHSPLVVGTQIFTCDLEFLPYDFDTVTFKDKACSSGRFYTREFATLRLHNLTRAVVWSTAL